MADGDDGEGEIGAGGGWTTSQHRRPRTSSATLRGRERTSSATDREAARLRPVAAVAGRLGSGTSDSSGSGVA
ncbi:hypothetical protein Scep_007179 [Stephania cephalantha]|uniref:Uncharacterized protein n=1 Tax=Stephania cephalantha TaxID=152367 RepID=A0AAP0K9K4_9MAGN